MFWGNTRKKRGDEEKEKQIKELKQVFPSIRRPNNDDNLFEIKFVVNNQYSSLRVFIPGDFPSTRPVLQAAGPISHPWLDQFKQVNGSDKLMSWTRNSSLVEVVEESLSALLTGSNQADGAGASDNTPYPAMATPSSLAYPCISGATQSIGTVDVAQNSGHSTYGNFSEQQVHSILPNPNSSTSIYPNLDVAPSAATTNPVPTPMQRQSSGKMSLPDLPSSFPELDKLTTMQLQKLLSDEVALNAHLAGVMSINAMQSVIEQVQQGNEEHARKNLSLEADVKAAVEEVEALQSTLKVQVHEYQERLTDVKKRCEVPRNTVLRELRVRKNELDSKTEELGANFVQGRVELSQFLAEFVEQRAGYHGLSAQLNIVG